LKEIDFNKKTFSLLENSEKGTVNSDAVFTYTQKGNLVTADYSGGTVVYGKIIARLKEMELDMLYQCLTTSNELKAGKAIAAISFSENGKIKLRLQW
jgi:hypothetical protein